MAVGGVRVWLIGFELGKLYRPFECYGRNQSFVFNAFFELNNGCYIKDYLSCNSALWKGKIEPSLARDSSDILLSRYVSFSA